MKENVKKKAAKKRATIYRALQLVGVGSITGVCAGAVVTVFCVLTELGEGLAREGYAYVRANPLWIPLLLVALAMGAFLLSVIVKASNVVRGCGIPQAEGATRGNVRLRWWRDATAMFAACLLSIFMGLSVGSEGPSVLIGACMGDGVSTTLKRNEMIRKYQVTGGACTGLAVAANAPLTGIVFAFEEAHKRFTPEVFICAFSSVIFGVLTRSAIYALLGLAVQSSFHSYQFFALPIEAYAYVVLAGVVCGVCGIAFQKFCLFVRRCMRKIKHDNADVRHGVRIFIAVFVGGALSLLTVGAMGGGHHLIESLGTHGGTVERHVETVFGLSLAWTLFLVLLLKFVATGVNIGASLPCGIFIPIIAIGACIGGVLSDVLPLEAKYYDLLVMICMAAFFVTVIRAPLTAVIMICEFTGSFAPLLPVIIAVSIGYFIGELSGSEGIYEELLEAYEHETGTEKRALREVYTLSVVEGALADGREVKDILWPAGTRVSEIRRGEEVILPEGDTKLIGGDVLVCVCRTDEPQKIRDELAHIVE